MPPTEVGKPRSASALHPYNSLLAFSQAGLPRLRCRRSFTVQGGRLYPLFRPRYQVPFLTGIDNMINAEENNLIYEIYLSYGRIRYE